MKKKNIWVIIVFFGFVCSYILTTSLLEEKLTSISEKYIDDASTCFAESANMLFEYYKNTINYIKLDEIENFRRSDLANVDEDLIYDCFLDLKDRKNEDSVHLGIFVELVDGKFISSENQYITKEVLFKPENTQILQDFKNDIEQKNTTCVSSSFLFNKERVCLVGKPIINKYNEYIGYKAIIANLRFIEEFETNLDSEILRPEMRISSTNNVDLYSTNMFYQTLDKRQTISKTIYLEEEGDYLTVCVDKTNILKYFYVYRNFTLIIWMFIVVFLCRELFAKSLMINRKFAYISGLILLGIVLTETLIFDSEISKLQDDVNCMQAHLCCFKDNIRINDYNELFFKMQRDINLKIKNTGIVGRPSEYIANTYSNVLSKIISDDKYGEYIFIVDEDGYKVPIHEGAEINFTINHNWFNYNQYLYNNHYYEIVDIADIDSSAIVLGLPIVYNQKVQSILCLVFNLDDYVNSLYSTLKTTSNEKVMVDAQGNAVTLKGNSLVIVEPLDAKAKKPYLSYSGIGQYRLIQKLPYRYEGKKGEYFVFDSYYAQRRIVFLRDNEERRKTEAIVILIIIVWESLLGISTYLINMNTIKQYKVASETKLAIQDKLKTFK